MQRVKALRAALIGAMLLAAATPGPAFDLSVSGPPQARPVGAPAFGRPLAIDFRALGRVTVRPFTQRTTAQRQCGAVLTRRGGRPQRLTTLGIGESETESCGTLIAVGRVPAPRGRYRLLFLYRNYAQFVGATEADSAIRPIVAVTTTRGPWQVDDALSARLNERGTTTIDAGRRALRNADGRQVFRRWISYEAALS